MNEELTTFIIKELRRHRDRHDVIEKVCKRGSLHRREAERLIILVEARHRRSLAKPRTPMLLFVSIGTLILGIGLLGFNLQTLLTFFQQDLLAQVVSLQGTSYRMIGLFTGLGMSIGGLVGLWKSFGVIFPE